MPLDSHGNFYPVFPGMPAFAASDSAILNGAGAPDNGLGNNGDVYVNISNSDIYTKAGGVWTLSGGAGSGFNNVNGVGSPVGVVTPNYVGQYYLDTTNPYNTWFSTGLTNADWVLNTGGITP